MKPALPKRTRAILLFLFGIVLPCLLLGYLAFRGVQNDLALLENRRVAEHHEIAEQVCQAVDESFLEAELAFQKFLSEKNPNNPSDMIQQLENLKGFYPLIEEVFSIQSNQKIQFFDTFLLYRLRNSMHFPGNSPLDQTIDRLLRQGQQLEFQRKDYNKALIVYRQALRETSDLQVQGDLWSKIARVQKKSKQFKGSLESYQTIVNKYSQIRLTEGIPLGLAARVEIGSLLVEREERAKALEVFMDLYQDLISGEWILEKEPYNFYSARIRDSIMEILSQEFPSEQMQSRNIAFRKLVDQENAKREQTERLLLFEEKASAEREMIELQSRENFSERRRFTLEIGTEAYLVCLLRNIPVEDEIWGFLVDRQQLIESLLPGIMQNMVFPDGTDWIIRGRNRKTVLASISTPPGSLTVKSDLIRDFPDWTIEFYQTDPRLLDALLTSRRGIYLYMFILIAGILVFGLILTMRSFTREIELSRIKSDFVSTVSHEFKSPLTSIRQIAEMLHSGRVPSEERRQKYYDVLLEQSERLSLLIENVLNFAKLEEGKREFVFEPVDFETLLVNIVSAIQDRVRHDGFVIEAKIKKSLPSVMADASAMTQAFNNLIDNALKYSGNSKKIIVRAYDDGQSVVIEVKDFGLGIKKEEMGRIFTRFYRGGDQLTNAVKGSGLGLTLVKQIVDAHKGSIRVESEEGKGSTFAVKLPLNPNKE